MPDDQLDHLMPRPQDLYDQLVAGEIGGTFQVSSDAPPGAYGLQVYILQALIRKSFEAVQQHSGGTLEVSMRVRPKLDVMPPRLDPACDPALRGYDPERY